MILRGIPGFSGGTKVLWDSSTLLESTKDFFMRLMVVGGSSVLLGSGRIRNAKSRIRGATIY